MDLQLKDKVIIVTGGARGIGEAISNVLAKEGAIPFIAGRSEEHNRNTVQAIKQTGGQADHVVAELTRPEECEKAVKAVVERWGRIDGLVNNAGENDGVGLEKG